MSKSTHELAHALRGLADKLETHPAAEIGDSASVRLVILCHDRENFAAAARVLGGQKKAEVDSYFFDLISDVGMVTVELSTPRSNVCRKITKLVEVESWECDPILADQQTPAGHQ